jgi:tricorn protease
LVSVVPVADEYALRHKAWEENNRRIVEEETHGRAGYIHVPDTNVDGWVAFNRYYYAQAERDGIIVDERFNRGGLFNDFMIHEMQKAPFAYFASQHGADEPTPGAGVFGPKVMLIDEASYSGGDLFPWLFRQQRLGPLVGKRTWGGLITNKGFGLADGGSFTSPDFGFYDNRSGRWDIENWGVAPDIDVELDPFPWRQGKDSQLERSIVEMNRLLAKYRPEAHRHPPYPDRTKVDVHP